VIAGPARSRNPPECHPHGSLRYSRGQQARCRRAWSEISRIAFSNAGDAETWNTPTAAIGSPGDYVELDPNDGEQLCAPVAFRNQLIVFKQTKFYVFYGNSTDADGNPRFNYRTMNTGVGARFDYKPTAVVAPDAVYFQSQTGFYRTTGGPPEKISQPFNAVFAGAADSFFSVSTPIDRAAATGGATYFDGRVYFTCADSSASVYYTFVYDIANSAWTVWKFAHAPVGMCVAPYTTLSLPDQVAIANLKSVYTFSAAATTDDGTALASKYRSSFYSPIGSPSQECAVRESIIDGIGSPSFSVSRDYGAVPTTGGGAKGTVTLGTSPAIAQGRHRISQRGRRFSYQIEATSGAWRVENIVQHITGIRSPGLKTG
jgi:hypothetical protein